MLIKIYIQTEPAQATPGKADTEQSLYERMITVPYIKKELTQRLQRFTTNNKNGNYWLQLLRFRSLKNNLCDVELTSDSKVSC